MCRHGEVSYKHKCENQTLIEIPLLTLRAKRQTMHVSSTALGNLSSHLQYLVVCQIFCRLVHSVSAGMGLVYEAGYSQYIHGLL